MEFVGRPGSERSLSLSLSRNTVLVWMVEFGMRGEKRASNQEGRVDIGAVRHIPLCPPSPCVFVIGDVFA